MKVIEIIPPPLPLGLRLVKRLNQVEESLRNIFCWAALSPHACDNREHAVSPSCTGGRPGGCNKYSLQKEEGRLSVFRKRLVQAALKEEGKNPQGRPWGEGQRRVREPGQPVASPRPPWAPVSVASPPRPPWSPRPGPGSVSLRFPGTTFGITVL